MATKELTIDEQVLRNEFDRLLDDIHDRAVAIKQSNETTINRDNVEFGLEMIENYCARLQQLMDEGAE